MSFSRARIQRFNELESDAPPPGSYDPKFECKIKGLVIEKTERFQDGKSVASGNTDCNASVSSKAASITAIPTFRTPQLPRKKSITKPTNLSCSKIKSKVVTTVTAPAKDAKPKYDLKNELADLKVECQNKDRTIQENEKLIEDMKEEILKLEKQLEELEKKQMEVDAQNKNNIDYMMELHKEVLDQHKKEHSEELASVRLQLEKRIKEAQDELQDAETRHAEAVEKYSSELCLLKKTAEERKLEFLAELDHVKVAADQMVAEAKETAAKEIAAAERRVNERADKMVKNAEDVTRETLAACAAESDERVRRIIAECDAKANQMEAKVQTMVKEAVVVVEEDMGRSLQGYRERLERQEADRRILEDKLTQKETEVNKLTVTLDVLKTSAMNQESSNQILQCELDHAEAELAEKKEELRTLKDQIRSEAAELVAKRRRFEVVMHENQATVTALSERLVNSDAEVERLQRELEWGEVHSRELRDLVNTMRANSRLAHDQFHDLLKEMDAKKEVIDQLEANNVGQIAAIKATFDAKIDALKDVAAKEITRLKEECDKKTEQNVEMKQQLDQMAGKVSDAQEMLSTMETLLLEKDEQNDEQGTTIARLQLDNVRIGNQLENETNRYSLLEIRLSEHIEEANRRITSLHDCLHTMTGKKNYWKSHAVEVNSLLKNEKPINEKEKLQRDELEKNLRNEIEEEINKRTFAEEKVLKLTDTCERLRKECSEITEKYAELIGHHNHKQKIKYLDKMKNEISQLKQKEERNENLILQQQRTIERLSSLPKGKENLSVHRSTTPVGSPHKQLTPLKDRN